MIVSSINLPVWNRGRLNSRGLYRRNYEIKRCLKKFMKSVPAVTALRNRAALYNSKRKYYRNVSVRFTLEEYNVFRFYATTLRVSLSLIADLALRWFLFDDETEECSSYSFKFGLFHLHKPKLSEIVEVYTIEAPG